MISLCHRYITSILFIKNSCRTSNPITPSSDNILHQFTTLRNKAAIRTDSHSHGNKRSRTNAMHKGGYKVIKSPQFWEMKTKVYL